MKKFILLIVLMFSITIYGGEKMANLQITNITSNGCNWQAYNLQPLTYDTYVKLTEGAIDYGTQSVAINATISGIGYVALDPGIHYLDCNRYRTSNDAYLGYVGTQIVNIPYPPTPPDTPWNLSVSNTGQGEIHASWSGSANTDQFVVRLVRTSDNYTTYYQLGNSSITISGLPNSTQFAVSVKAFNDYGESSYCSAVYITTLAPVRPSNFTLFYSLAGTSVSLSGHNVSLVDASDLLAFRNAIDDFRGYKGLGSANISVPLPGGAATAAYINLYRTAISQMNPPTALPSAAVQGAVIDPDYFVKLQASLNSIQ